MLMFNMSDLTTTLESDMFPFKDDRLESTSRNLSDILPS